MSDLEPEIRASELPAETASARQRAETEFADRAAYWRPRVEAHLAVYQEVIETLIQDHRQIADRTNLEIGANTRWSAMWEMSGRCLSISRVLLHDARAGFCSESDGTLRALHEAVQLLAALAFHEEEGAVRRWLAGDWIRPHAARAIQRRQQELADTRMREAGLEPPASDVAALGQEIYSMMSASAHHERGGFPESIDPALREFAYGPHPDPVRSAGHLNFAGELLEEVVIVVGSAIGDIIGGEYRTEVVRPLQAMMARVREEMPLPG